MSIHRGIAASAALAIALTTAACDSDSNDTDDPTTAPTTASASPARAQATTDPAVDSVPLPGDENVPIEWVLEGAASDPVIDVARRTIALLLLASSSPSWSEPSKIESPARALAAPDYDLAAKLEKQTVSSPPADAGDPVRILAQQPDVSGADATVWLCIDYRAKASGSDNGTPVTVDLTVIDGLWKATSYNLNPEVTDADQSRSDRCSKDF